jgi:hypothetical protein
MTNITDFDDYLHDIIPVLAGIGRVLHCPLVVLHLNAPEVRHIEEYGVPRAPQSVQVYPIHRKAPKVPTPDRPGSSRWHALRLYDERRLWTEYLGIRIRVKDVKPVGPLLFQFRVQRAASGGGDRGFIFSLAIKLSVLHELYVFTRPFDHIPGPIQELSVCLFITRKHAHTAYE